MPHFATEFHGFSFSLQELPLQEKLSAHSILGPEQRHTTLIEPVDPVETNEGLGAFVQLYTYYLNVILIPSAFYLIRAFYV
jgi:hypothetical protein